MKARIGIMPCVVFAIGCLMLCTSAMASTLAYSNGLDDRIDSWTISPGYSVADSFYLGAKTLVTEIDVYVTEWPLDTVVSLQWQVSAGPAGGMNFGVADTTNSRNQGLLVDTYLGSDKYGYELHKLSVTFLSGFVLPTNTYYLTLSNATSKGNNPVFWDENDGFMCTGWDGTKKGCPSLARDSQQGPIGSEVFSIYGTF